MATVTFRRHRGLAIGGHSIRAAGGHGIQRIDGMSLIAHGQSIQCLFDATQTRLQTRRLSMSDW